MQSHTPRVQPRNPLHGLTLEQIVTALVEHYGWEGLGERVAVRCFQIDPSVKSSLKFCARHPGRVRKWRASTSSCGAAPSQGHNLLYLEKDG